MILQINVNLYLSNLLVLLNYLIQVIITSYLDYFLWVPIHFSFFILAPFFGSYQMIFLKLKLKYIIQLLKSLPTVLMKILNYLTSSYMVLYNLIFYHLLGLIFFFLRSPPWPIFKHSSIHTRV